MESITDPKGRAGGGIPVAKTLKTAATDWAAFMVTVQACVPEHAPLHPVKIEPEDGVAKRVTVVPLLYVALQAAPQLIRPSLLVTVPVPAPCRVTVRLNV